MEKRNIPAYPKSVSDDLPIGGTADPEWWSTIYPVKNSEVDDSSLPAPEQSDLDLEALRMLEVQRIQLRHSLLE